MVDTSQRSAIGGQQHGNVTFGVMPEQIVKQLQSNSSSEFIVIQRARQSEEPQVWTTGDQTQARQLLRQAYDSQAFSKDSVTT